MSERICDLCDHNPQRVSKPYRCDMAKCDGCEYVLCAPCLRRLAATYGLDVGQTKNAQELLFHCEESKKRLCAECFETA